MSWRITRRGKMVGNGTGVTENISSDRITFLADQPVPPDDEIEVGINWPARIEKGPKLRLVATGIVRSRDGTRTTLEIKKYEFRTRATDVHLLYK